MRGLQAKGCPDRVCLSIGGQGSLGGLLSSERNPKSPLNCKRRWGWGTLARGRLEWLFETQDQLLRAA